MRRVHRQQMGPLFRPNCFRIPFQTKPPLSSVPIKMSQFSSLLLREEIEILLRKRAVVRVQNPEIPGFYSRIIWYQKERKVTANYRSFSTEPIHQERTFPNGDSQVSKKSDVDQRLGCLNRSDRCISSHSDSSTIKKVSSIRIRRSNSTVHGRTLRNVSVRGFSPR